MPAPLDAPGLGSLVAVRCTRVEKTYATGAQPALAGVDLEVPGGSFFGLLGINGAGKTTLISILCGVLRADAGDVALRAVDGRWLDPRAARGLLGLVPQQLAFYPSLVVSENLHFFAEMHGLRGAARRRAVETAVRIGRLEAVLRAPAQTLSGGLQRRLNLAIGVVHAPRLLILDEPTVGVDVQSRLYLQQELKRLNESGVTIIYTSHYLEEVQQLCDTLAIIDAGRIVATGPIAELLRERSLTLRVGAALHARVIHRLRAIRGVDSVACDGERVVLLTDAPQQVLAEALVMLDAEHVELQHASIGARDLQTLFFESTARGGHHVR